ncbi:unnamed protein product [Lupinus luteus]|uniref:UBX domain-containing protein n=1 Tax=Lupinus luteus TaxID=3873 RepID=A0AAV1XN07_LUPLU
MFVGGSLTSKRRKVTTFYSMASQSSKAKLADLKERFGREIRVFETSVLSPSSNAASSNGEETDDFYEFTSEDYFRILATKKEDKFLKTRKLREADEKSRRSKITKAVIRVRFPDNHTLEATFHPSETIQSLIDLLNKVIAQPGQPYYIYTTPPKKVVNDLSQDFYTAGFCPGAIVYFSYNVPKGDSTVVDHIGHYLRDEILSLKDLDVSNDEGQQSEPEQPAPEPAEATRRPPIEERKPAEKKLVKPKWLKM